jgi:hypothetical protein
VRDGVGARDGAGAFGTVDGVDVPGAMDGADSPGARDGAGTIGTRDEVDDPDARHVALGGLSAGQFPVVVVEVDATGMPELKRGQSDSAKTTYR